MLNLHSTILSNYYTNYTNTTGTEPQEVKDNDYPVAINIKTCKYKTSNQQLTKKL